MKHRHRWSWLLATTMLGTTVLIVVVAIAQLHRVEAARDRLLADGILTVVVSPLEALSPPSLLTELTYAWGGETIIFCRPEVLNVQVTDDVWLRNRERFHVLPTVTEVVFSESDIHRQTLQTLIDFPDLRRLSLADCPVTDEDVAVLADVRNLQSLTLRNTQVTGVALRSLETLPKLTHLVLDGSPIDADGITAIGYLRSLTSISLSNVGLPEGEIVRLAKALPGVMISDD